MTTSSTSSELAASTADIIAAYVSNNAISRDELPDLIRKVHEVLANAGAPAPPPAPKPKRPAVPIKDSVTRDSIICLEDGQSYRCLTKHLWSKYRMTPSDYRAKWGLPLDYPMSAPSYSDLRATMARSMGLGTERTRVRSKKGGRSRDRKS